LGIVDGSWGMGHGFLEIVMEIDEGHEFLGNCHGNCEWVMDFWEIVMEIDEGHEFLEFWDGN